MAEETLTVNIPGMDAASQKKSFRAMDAAQIQDSWTFLEAELEKRDPTLLEPLTAVTWPRDIVAVTGGGMMQYSSNFFVDYGSPNQGTRAIGGDQQTNIPMIEAKLSKDTYKAYLYQIATAIPIVQQMYMTEVGRSLDQIYDSGIRLDYNKFIDNLIYFGRPIDSNYGIVNNANVAVISPSTVSTSLTSWEDKINNGQVDAVLADINAMLVKVWADCEYDTSAMPNHLGVTPRIFGLFVTAKVSQAGNISVLEYLKNNNISRAQGVDLEIVPMRQLMGAGTSSTDRAIAYCNDKRFFHFDLLQPLMRHMTGPDVANARFVSQYLANMTAPKLLYPTTQVYMDGV